MHWAAKYIGMRHTPGGRGPKEVDCWGLVRLVYHNEFGIVLPDLPGISVASALKCCETGKQVFRDSWQEEADPVDGCLVAMSQKTAIHHVGIFICIDGGRILHCWDGQSAIADTFPGLRFKGFSTIKYYQHNLWLSSLKLPIRLSR